MRKTRYLSAVTLIAIAFPCHSAPVPVPKGDKEVYYHAYTIGTQWTMGDPDSPDHIGKYTIKESIHTKEGYVITIVSDDSPNYSKMIVSSNGVVKDLESMGKKLSPPIFQIKSVKKGDTWKVDSRSEDFHYKATYTCGEEKEITVPAGKFLALPIHIEYSFDGDELRKSTHWHAKNVGLVRMDDNDVITYVMKSFTPGKK